MFKLSLVVAVAGGCLGAQGAMLDLTAAGSSGTLNGAHFFTNQDQSTGTGVFRPFVRIQANGSEQGYNTSGSPLPFDEKAGAWTRDLRLTELGTTWSNGTEYYEFRLDINESNGGKNRLLSLDRVKIYTSPVGGKTTTNLASLGTLRFDLDANEDNWVKLDYSLGSGSGSGDMTMLVPVANFAGAASDSYVYFYSAFGTNHAANAGFEEWAAKQVVPAPASTVLALMGLAVIGRRKRIG